MAFLISAGTAVRAQDTVNLANFGYIVNSRSNAVPVVKKAIEECRNRKNAVLVFPKGRYDFWPDQCTEKLYYESNSDVIPLRRCPILIEGLHNFTIDFSGSDLIFHGRMQPLTIDNSSNIKIKNLSINWEIPMTAQGQIISTGENYIEIKINAESPYEIRNEKIFFKGEDWESSLSDIMEFDSKTKFIAQGCGDGCLGDGFYSYKARVVNDSLVRIDYSMTRRPATGNFLALRHSARDHAGTFIVNSKNISLDNFKMFQNAGLGILSQYSENLQFTDVHCVPDPASNRVFAGHDDGMHFSNCKGRITVSHCRFAGLMDDPVNIHGTSVQITKKKDNRTLLCKFMHDQSIGTVWARKGEKAGFIENASMYSNGTGIVESFTPLNEREFEIRFKKEVPESISAGDALENLTWTPDVWINNNFFGSCRARGLLVTTPGKVVIERNIFESSGSAILIAGDANGWFESGGVKEVLIRNNIFNDPCLSSVFQFCEAIISIYPEIPQPETGKPFHRNIRIENNTFHPFDYPVLYAKSVEGLIFSGNTLKRSNRFKTFHKRKYMITLDYCKKITISKNKFAGDVLGKSIKLNHTPPAELNINKRQGLVIVQ